MSIPSRFAASLNLTRQSKLQLLSVCTHWPTNLQAQQIRCNKRFIQTAATASSAARKLRHILLPHNNPSSDWEKAERLQNLLEQGEDFSALAKQNSVCVSAQAGGELGWVTSETKGLPNSLHSYVLDDEREVDELGLVESEWGVHIVQVTAERASMAEIKDMKAQDLRVLLHDKDVSSSRELVQLIDVREESEREIAGLPGFELLPLSRQREWLPSLHDRFNKDVKTVCLCHHGVRSRMMADFLIREGFQDVHNVTGGIDAYSIQADSSIARY